MLFSVDAPGMLALESLPNYEKLKAIVTICFFSTVHSRLKMLLPSNLPLPETNSQRPYAPEKLVIPKGKFHLQSVGFSGAITEKLQFCGGYLV